jgi:hypothetical protein
VQSDGSTAILPYLMLYQRDKSRLGCDLRLQQEQANKQASMQMQIGAGECLHANARRQMKPGSIVRDETFVWDKTEKRPGFMSAAVT